MATYYVSPTGTGDGSTEATPMAPAATQAVAVPGCTFVILPGVYNDGLPGYYGEPDYFSGPHNPFRIEFRPGADFTGKGNNRGHGITIEGYNGVEIIDAYIHDLADKPNGCAVWAYGCKNLKITRPKFDNCYEWGIHLPHCHDVLVEGPGWLNRARRQHGIYAANSASNVTIRGLYILGNHLCGVQSNGDATNAPIPNYKGLPFTGAITNLVVEDCVFGYNGAGGGGQWNCDAVVGGIWRRNTHLPTRGKGNAFAIFNSSYNPEQSRDILIEDNIVFGGPQNYNIFVSLGNGPKNLTVRNNTLVHTGYPANAQAGMLELFPEVPLPLEGVVFEGNKLSHDLVVKGDGTLAKLADVGITGANTILTAEQIAAAKALLPDVADPGVGTGPPPPPPPPPPPLEPLPDDAPPAEAADEALVDLNEPGSLWLREWHRADMFGSDYNVSMLHVPALGTTTGPNYFYGFTPSGKQTYIFGLRWTGFIRPEKSGVYELHIGCNQTYDLRFCGESLASVTANSHDIVWTDKTVKLEAGKFYAFDFGILSTGGYAVTHLKYRTAEKPEAYVEIPMGWFYAVKDRPGVTVPPTEPPPTQPPPTEPPPTQPPPTEPPPTQPPPTQPPVAGQHVFSTEQLIELIRAAAGK